MKPIHYLFAAGVIAMVFAGGSSKSEPVWPGDRVTPEMRAQGIELLKEAYRYNNSSMVGWGAFENIQRHYGPQYSAPMEMLPKPSLAPHRERGR